MTETQNTYSDNVKLAEDLYLAYLLPQMVGACQQDLTGKTVVGLPAKELRYVQDVNRIISTLSSLASSEIIELFSDLRSIEEELSTPYNIFVDNMESLQNALPGIRFIVGQEIPVTSASVKAKRAITEIKKATQTITRNLEERRISLYPSKAHEIIKKITAISEKIEQDLDSITSDLNKDHPGFIHYKGKLATLKQNQEEAYSAALSTTLITAASAAMIAGFIITGVIVTVMSLGTSLPITVGVVAGGSITFSAIALDKGSEVAPLWQKYSTANQAVLDFINFENNKEFKVYAVFDTWSTNLKVISSGLEKSKSTLESLTDSMKADIQESKPTIDAFFDILSKPGAVTQAQLTELSNCAKKIEIENSLIKNLQYLFNFRASSIGCLAFEVN
ncbi:hypothetical protein [Photorhabdus khanii]|uniref:Uncharacterized protein n=1 Tax=Photorhabdus khanii subsp. guanajuatensis TaxID=2100166 RepID=A0A4R4IQC2_9GAMM|nr:hypothetical protein [Photorhabdus khanii]TDB42642.1 hypothetical protein C5467_23695 [Photorhabdus khanii subsp. guanajuatensis]